MKGMLAAALAATALGGCNVYREATSTRPDLSAPWRAVATDDDRNRLRNWRKAWNDALPAARAADAGAMAADPNLFDPDRAMPDGATPPPGKYRCRTFKLGAAGTAMRDFTTYPAFECQVQNEGEVSSLHKRTGSQRPTGLLFAETPARSIFLGTLVLGDEVSPLRYGLDAQRDLVGYVERIEARRWRLVFPYPRFESKLDIIELVPAG